MHLLIAAALVAADQLSKLWAAGTFPLGGQEYPLGLGFHLTYVKNTGAAFGFLQNIDFNLGPLSIDGTFLLGVLSALVAAVIFAYLLRHNRTLPGLQRWALTLILAGAVGNMIDRFRLGYVIDFIHFRLPNFDYPVFNLADSCVVIGAGLLLLSSFTPERPPLEPAEPKHHTEPDYFQPADLDKPADNS